MPLLELQFETWWAMFDALRATPVPHHQEHADVLERFLEEHGPGEELVRLGVSDDVYLRSVNWARIAD